ncbi:sensor histidine kinase [Roseixanthobacter pseudopolyaromaticivorans]|uniref:sensor histidine kinase n=1 Tax=Xanthobacteraceae TaxID=335928 RepID=UPI003727EE74
MNLSFDKLTTRGMRLVSAAMVVTTIVFFVATVMVYNSTDSQRSMLAKKIHNSGWIVYQAQLEFLKATSRLRLAAVSPSADEFDALKLRLELLRSRLPVLYESDEADLLPGLTGYKPELQIFEQRLDGMIDALSHPDLFEVSGTDVFHEWDIELQPLGRLLQRVLLSSVSYNEATAQIEAQLDANPARIPLLLLFASGTILVLILLAMERRVEMRLTEVMQGQAALQSMESSLLAVIQATPACVIVFDPASEQVRLINPAALAVVDAPLSDPDWKRLTRAAREVAVDTNGNPWGGITMTFSRRQGDVVSLRGSLCEVLWHGTPQALLVVADTSRIRHAELQVMQAAKLATLGEMATAIAHELNQPLAVIKMATANAARLLQSGAGHELVQAKLERIQGQVDRAKRITDQVRRYARMPTDHSTSFSIRAALELAAGFVAEQYRAAGIQLLLRFNVSPDVMVVGEQIMFEQLIVNLLVNARDACESHALAPGGAPPRVLVHCRVEDDHVIIEVDDNAGGIAPDILPHLFEAFTTTKPADKGTGLGLSLSRTVVRDMGGTISAANLAEGARFTVDIPRLPAPVSAMAE